MARKKEEEDEEANLNLDTEYQLEVAKSALDKSGLEKTEVNSAILHLLDNYHGKYYVTCFSDAAQMY